MADLDHATDSQWDWVAEHTRTYLASGGTEGHENNGCTRSCSPRPDARPTLPAERRPQPRPMTGIWVLVGRQSGLFAGQPATRTRSLEQLCWTP